MKIQTQARVRGQYAKSMKVRVPDVSGITLKDGEKVTIAITYKSALNWRAELYPYEQGGTRNTGQQVIEAQVVAPVSPIQAAWAKIRDDAFYWDDNDQLVFI